MTSTYTKYNVHTWLTLRNYWGINGVDVVNFDEENADLQLKWFNFLVDCLNFCDLILSLLLLWYWEDSCEVGAGKRRTLTFWSFFISKAIELCVKVMEKKVEEIC